jgi:hypothetical protein
MACASAPPVAPQAKRPVDMAPSDVMIRPIGSLACGPGGTAPLHLGVRVTNRASESIMIRSVRITTPEGQRVAIHSGDVAVNGFLEASQTDIFPVTVTAMASDKITDRSLPVSLRAEIEFEARGVRFREVFDLANLPL